MIVETYRKEAPIAPVQDNDQERKELLKSLGLHALMDIKEGNQDLARKLYVELTGDLLRGWHIWLQCIYHMMPFEDTSANGRHREFSDYKFDSIPTECLQEIATARSLGVFTDIEIWTPEKVDPMAVGVIQEGTSMSYFPIWKVDPMAVGVIQEGTSMSYFPICRWGEALIPLDSIWTHLHKENVPQDLQKLVSVDTFKTWRWVGWSENPLFGWGFAKKSIERHCGQTAIHSRIQDGCYCSACGKKVIPWMKIGIFFACVLAGAGALRVLHHFCGC